MIIQPMNMKQINRSYPLLLLTVLLLLWPSFSQAQVLLSDSHQGSGLSIRVFKPNVNRESRTAFPRTAIFVDAYLEIGGRLRIIADIPFSHSRALYLTFPAFQLPGYEYPEDFQVVFSQSHNRLGNPYIGIELPANDLVFLEVGGRLRVANDSMTSVRWSNDPIQLCHLERYEAFLANASSFNAGLNLRDWNFGRFVLGAKLGIQITSSLPYSSSPTRETEFFVISGTSVSMRIKKAALGVSYQRRDWPTREPGDYYTGIRGHAISIYTRTKLFGFDQGIEVTLPKIIARDLKPRVVISFLTAFTFKQ